MSVLGPRRLPIDYYALGKFLCVQEKPDRRRRSESSKPKPQRVAADTEVPKKKKKTKKPVQQACTTAKPKVKADKPVSRPQKFPYGSREQNLFKRNDGASRV